LALLPLTAASPMAMRVNLTLDFSEIVNYLS